MRVFLVGFFCFYVIVTSAQRPTITSVDPLSTYPVNSLLITGSGFGNSTASLQVWFGQVKGTLVSVSDGAIVVAVPPQARLQTVEVINLTSRLSAKSPLKFMPVFSGEGFSAAKLAPALSFTSTNAVFDICACDLDGDNKPDLVGTRFESTATDMMVLHNQSTPGNMAFAKFDKTNLPALNINAPTGHITCGDLNNDGKPDLVASRSGTTANSIFILRNTSAGSPNFAAPIELLLETGHFARHVFINDLNSDGKPEIVVSNSFNNVLYIFMNQSAGGTLSINPVPVKITLTGISNSLALEIQDMDGDRLPDIVLAQNQAANVFILKNESAGTINFSAPQAIMVPGALNDLTSADFNNDGKLDLVVTSVFTAQVMVLLNQTTTSTYSFRTPITLTTGSGPFGVDVSDIDGNGFADIIVPSRGTNTIDVFLHDGNTTPGFTRVVVATAKPSWFTQVADFDGDAKPDIAFTSFTAPSTFSVDILRNKNCHLPQILNEPPLTICAGQTIRLEAIPVPNVTFNWREGATSKKNGTEAFLDITAAGTYTVTATGEGGACAVTSAPMVVSSGLGVAPVTPVINPILPACAGSTMSISTASVVGATYLWQGPGGFTATESDATLSIPNVTSAMAGLYTLQVKVGDCTSSPDTEIALVVDLASFTVSSNTSGPLCEGQSALLSVNAVTGYQYQWIKDGADLGGSTNNSLTVTADGTYKTRITYLGCSTETATKTVTLLNKPVASFDAKSTACVGELMTFTNNSVVDSRASVVYGWDFSDGQVSAAVNPTHTYVATQTYSPTLTVSYTGVSSCSANQAKTVTITDAVPPEILADVSVMCPGDNNTLVVEGTYNTFDWSSGETAPFITIDRPGTYSVTTTDAGGCVGMDTITIEEPPGCGTINLDIPKMFSPNGDAKNDRWIISGVESYSRCTMKVYDDKGVNIYQQTGYPPEGWDGIFNGRSLPDGVYYYIFSCPDSDRPLTGSVLIIR